MTPVESPQMVSSVKLCILKKEEYTHWSMRMEQYISNIDYGLWQVIMNGDEPVQTTRDENGVETKVPSNTAQAILERQRERKAKSILLLAIPDEYQPSLLEVHGVTSSNENANQKFLRALPSSWNNIALIMRNTDGIDELDIDDLYNNLKVFKADIKGSSGSSSNSQNVAFLSPEDTNSINELNSPQLDDEDLEQIDHDDLEKMDLKWQVVMLSMRVKRFYKKTERKLNFGSKEPIGFDKTKVECFNCHRRGHFARECRAQRNQRNMNGDARYRNRDNNKRTVPVETSDALVVQDNALIVQDGLEYDWSYIAQEEPTKFALMAYTSGSDTEVAMISTRLKKFYKKTRKNLYFNAKEPVGEELVPQMAPVESPQMVSSVKLHILKKEEYTHWSMRMEQDENGVETEVPSKTAQAILARQRERKAKSILLLAIPDEYQLSLLEVHGATGSNENANQKFLRALPSSWNNIALIIRNTEGIDELDIDDLYNNLKVFKADIKGHSSFGQASSSSYTDDMMFLFFVILLNGPQLDDEDLEQIDHDDLEKMDLKWYVVMLSMRVKRFYKKTERKLNFNSNEPIGFDKTKVECFNCHRRGHFARECRAPRNQGNMNGDARYRNRDNNKRTIQVETSDALVVQDNALIVQDGLEYDWSYIAQEEPTKFALLAYTSGSDTKEKIAVLEFEVKDKVLPSVFDSRSSDGDDNPTNDRFKKGDGYHAVPPSLTGNYMPPFVGLSFARLDDYVYRPTTNKASASISKGEPSVIKTSNISVEMPKVDSVRTSRVIIKD
nr:hypothetical protein [Tanacetum cinerariifolium]